ncbi:hypothetical protein [Bradyrhizobium arachidis]|nr:hypothetical protein [Bradyrhizobium arachidis]
MKHLSERSCSRIALRMGQIEPIRRRNQSSIRHVRPNHVDEDDGARFFRGLLIAAGPSLLLWLCLALSFKMIIEVHLLP